MSRRTAMRGSSPVPGDKSISHRALVFAALADGASHVTGLNSGDDVRATAACLQAMGTELTWGEDGTSVTITGFPTGLSEPDNVLDAGNSGTTIRTLLGVVASVRGISVLTGDPSIRGRPMLRVVEPLRAMGAQITGRAGGELAPLVVQGAELSGLEHELRVASAQVKTALLLAGLGAEGVTRVVEPGPSRDHTERMLSARGIELELSPNGVSVSGGQRPRPLDQVVPGDLSSAMFLIVAALLLPASDLTLTGVGLNPTRTGALDVLKEMGADLTWEVDGEQGGEPVGNVVARYSSSLRGIAIDPALVPTLIDEIPALVIAASQAEGETVISGAAELRVKESDRISAMTQGLRSIGGDIDAQPDGMIVRGPAALGAGVIDSGGDHRVAMSFAVAGMIAKGDVKVQGWSAVQTSFPEFVSLVRGLRGRR